MLGLLLLLVAGCGAWPQEENKKTVPPTLHLDDYSTALATHPSLRDGVAQLETWLRACGTPCTPGKAREFVRPERLSAQRRLFPTDLSSHAYMLKAFTTGLGEQIHDARLVRRDLEWYCKDAPSLATCVRSSVVDFVLEHRVEVLASSVALSFLSVQAVALTPLVLATLPSTLVGALSALSTLSTRASTASTPASTPVRALVQAEALWVALKLHNLDRSLFGHLLALVPGLDASDGETVASGLEALLTAQTVVGLFLANGWGHFADDLFVLLPTILVARLLLFVAIVAQPPYDDCPFSASDDFCTRSCPCANGHGSCALAQDCAEGRCYLGAPSEGMAAWGANPAYDFKVEGRPTAGVCLSTPVDCGREGCTPFCPCEANGPCGNDAECVGNATCHAPFSAVVRWLTPAVPASGNGGGGGAGRRPRLPRSHLPPRANSSCRQVSGPGAATSSTARRGAGTVARACRPAPARRTRTASASSAAASRPRASTDAAVNSASRTSTAATGVESASTAPASTAASTAPRRAARRSSPPTTPAPGGRTRAATSVSPACPGSRPTVASLGPAKRRHLQDRQGEAGPTPSRVVPSTSFEPPLEVSRF